MKKLFPLLPLLLSLSSCLFWGATSDFVQTGFSEMSVEDPNDTLEFDDDIKYHNGYCYHTAGQNGLNIIDVSDPLNCRIVPYELNFGAVYGIDFKGDIAFLLTSYDELSSMQIIDVSSLPELTVLGTLENVSGNTIRVDGEYAYISSGNIHEVYGDFIICNISNSSSPLEVSRIADSNILDFQISGDFIFFLSQEPDSMANQRFRVMDVSDRVNPVVFDTYAFPGGHSIEILDDYVFIYDFDGDHTFGHTLYSVDVSNPAVPIYKDSLKLAGVSTGRAGPAIYKDLLLIPDNEDGLEMVDISNTSSLLHHDRLLSLVPHLRFSDRGRFMAVASGGDWAYILAAEGLYSVSLAGY